MVMVYMLGEMVEGMKAIMNKIKNMDLENILGLMADNMKETGSMANNMVKENTLSLMVQ